MWCGGISRIMFKSKANSAFGIRDGVFERVEGDE